VDLIGIIKHARLIVEPSLAAVRCRHQPQNCGQNSGTA
jgi:hypothetical protein